MRVEKERKEVDRAKGKGRAGQSRGTIGRGRRVFLCAKGEIASTFCGRKPMEWIRAHPATVPVDFAQELA